MLAQKIFMQELDLIKNDNIRKFATTAIDLLPNYFDSVSATSTGKYHPPFSQGVGGLVRHTKAAVRMLSDLFRTDIFDYLTEYEKDLMLVAALLHDGMKWGVDNEPTDHTVFNHPLLIANFIKEEKKLAGLLPQTDLDTLSEWIAAHMGRWNTNTHYDYQLPTPVNRAQKVLHMVDYIVSRSYITFDLELEAPRRW
jgi:hypothetical protein